MTNFVAKFQCPQQEVVTNLCGYYVCRHMISIYKSDDSCDDPRELVRKSILINIFYSTHMAHSDLKNIVAHLKTEDP